MKITRFTGKDIRRILTGMITNRYTLGRVSAVWEPPGLFGDDWANLVGSWAVQYFGQYDEPPKNQIQALFEQWAKKNTTGDKTVELVERFLYQMSEEFDPKETVNEKYLVDLAAAYFNKVRLRQEMERAEQDLDGNAVDEAWEKLGTARKVNLGVGSWLNPHTDTDLVERAVSRDRARPLIVYPGAAGAFLSPMMRRGKLIGITAPDKTGKSYHLLDAAHRAAAAKYRVAYFDAGDMDEEEVTLRFGIRAARKPEEAGEVSIVTKIGEKGAPLETKTRKFDEGIDAVDIQRAFNRTFRTDDRLRLCCYPNDTLTLGEIDSNLTAWASDGWVADVIVIDYADIMKPPPDRDMLDRIDSLWKGLRRLSQERHALVLTATQSSAQAYSEKKFVLRKKHFSGRKTKLAHVDGMLGLNVCHAREGDELSEKELGMCRLNWIVRRKGRYSEDKVIYCAGSLALGCPIIRSSW